MTTLIKTNQIAKSFNQLVALQRDVPMSLAYYTLIDANSQPVQKLPKNFPDFLPANLRQFIAVTWDEAKGSWEFNRNKADKLREKLGLKFKESTFEEVVAAIDAANGKPKAERDDAQKTEAAFKAIAKQIGGLIALGLSSAEIEVKLKDAILAELKKASGLKVVSAAA